MPSDGIHPSEIFPIIDRDMDIQLTPEQEAFVHDFMRPDSDGRVKLGILTTSNPYHSHVYAKMLLEELQHKYEQGERSMTKSSTLLTDYRESLDLDGPIVPSGERDYNWLHIGIEGDEVTITIGIPMTGENEGSSEEHYFKTDLATWNEATKVAQPTITHRDEAELEEL